MNGSIPVQQTALLVIDVQNDFCAPDGKMAQFGADLSTVDEAVERMMLLTQTARQIQLPIIFIRLITVQGADSPAMLTLYERQGFDATSVAVCRTGTEGADYYKIVPEPEDIVIDKMRYSGFVGTNLDLILKAKGIRTLIATGVTTECCVDSTVRDGFMRDYEMFVVGDACAAYEAGLHEWSLKAMSINFATVVHTEELVSGWLAHKRGV